MSGHVTKRPKARRDLLDIFVYLEQHNPRAAARFLRAADETLNQLAFLPGLGSPLEMDILGTPPLRFRAIHRFKKYFIFYRETEFGIEVWRVLHGARDLQRALEES